jgi:hypothetical protein
MIARRQILTYSWTVPDGDPIIRPEVEMSKIWRFVAVVTPVLACNAQQDERTLNGFWGGAQAVWEITATPANLTLTQGCYRVTFPSPLHFVTADSFELSGSITSSTWRGEIGEPWRMWGAIVGDTLRFSWSYRYIADTTKWIGHDGPQTKLIVNQHSPRIAHPICPY